MRVNEPGPVWLAGTHYGLLAGILVLAAGLRLININSQGLWGDEGLTLVLVRWPILEMLWQPLDPTPFLYYALHKLSGAGPEASAGAVRGIAFACGMLSVGAMYLLGRLAYGAGAGLLAAALLAVWPQHVDYSQEARAYVLLFLLTVCSAAALLWWHRLAGESSAKRWCALMAFVLTTALAFAAHLVAIFWILLALQLFLIAALTAKRKRIGELAGGLALLALLALPGTIRLVRQFGAPTNFTWLRQASPEQFVETTANLLLPFGSAWLQLLFLAVAGSLVWRSRRAKFGQNAEPHDQIVQLLILAFLFVPVLIWAAGFSVRPIFMERTILFAAPGAILAIVALARSIPERLAGVGFGVATVLSLLGATVVQGTMRQRENWRGAARFLEQNVRSGDLILLCAWQYPSLRHATNRPLPAPLLHVTRGQPAMLEERLGGRRDWDAIFFRYNVVPNTRRIIAPPVGEATLRPGASTSLWLVESECPDESRRSIAEWLGRPAPWQKVWLSSRPAVGSEIGIFRHVLQSPAALTVFVPHELDWPEDRE
ncbi:MAG TPA: glycosyltransferase family 39 protein [Allosphingosinicella sp.]|jgi:hypothetical protein|uniref:hypothetical protein n=1 Tax=Allosphingosinicella sp. TaxID=2823234 RepID=UPI002F27C135